MSLARRFLAAAACVAASGGASGGASPRRGRPNFLLLFPDQYRGDWLPGLDDAHLPLRMPTLRALAAGGTRFTQAYVPSPLCAPSRASLASAREYDANGGVVNNGQDYNLTLPTYYSLLRAAGYRVMTSGKDDLTKRSSPGADGSFHADALGFVDYARCDGKGDVINRGVPVEPYGLYCAARNTTLDNGTVVTLWDVLTRVDPSRCCVPLPAGGAGGEDCPIPTAIPDASYEDTWVAANALQLLDRTPRSGAPWLLTVSFPGPHPPFITTASMLNATAGRVWPLAVDNTATPVASQQELRRDYAAELENLDRLFGLLLDSVRARGELDDTVVAVFSDHGELLGDYAQFGKEQPWRGSSSVPLVFSAPALGVPVGRSIDAVPVATLDVVGTILEFAGVAPAPGMTTQSLRPFFAAGAPAATVTRPFVSSGLTNHGFGWRMVVQADGGGHIWKLVCCTGAFCIGRPPTPPHASSAATLNFTEWLTETVADPLDLINVAAQLPAVVDALRVLLPPGWCR